MLLPLQILLNLQPVVVEPQGYFRTFWPRRPGGRSEMPHLPGMPVYPPDPLPPPMPIIEPLHLALERARARTLHQQDQNAIALLLLH